MTNSLRFCYPCGEQITDPDDAVYLGHEMSDSGPGWDLYAHRAHVEQSGPDPVATRIVARLLIVQALRR
ncbi:hypothetical protein [Streptomyces broussonetiae]|uniref:Uncharacterized protein n=1 Tax=Streptomyces broussonetiae TaxID=2686304 RepID=A0ABV5EMA8_9ACTN